MSKKRKYAPKHKKGIVRLSMAISEQTYDYLCYICAFKGWGDKDIGRAVDVLSIAHKTAARGETNGKKKDRA